MINEFRIDTPPPRKRAKATNVTFDPALVEEARALGVNISQASARGVEAAVREARTAQWLDENREALDASNEWVRRNGLPLAKYRLF